MTGILRFIVENPIQQERLEQRVPLQEDAANRTEPTGSHRVLGGVHLALVDMRVAHHGRFDTRGTVRLKEHEPARGFCKRQAVVCGLDTHREQVFLRFWGIGDELIDPVGFSVDVFKPGDLEKRTLRIEQVEALPIIVEVCGDRIHIEMACPPHRAPHVPHAGLGHVGV